MKRRELSPNLKRKVVLQAMRGNQAVRAIAALHGTKPPPAAAASTQTPERRAPSAGCCLRTTARHGAGSMAKGRWA